MQRPEKGLEGKMAVYFYTADPRGLLNTFKAAIRQPEPQGKITTWRQWDDDDNYFTHTSTQWASLAWMRAAVEEEKGRLTFCIVKPRNGTVSQAAYGFYHGHMIETFLNHFDTLFKNGMATALADDGDVIV
jgi:hypothetical protein